MEVIFKLLIFHFFQSSKVEVIEKKLSVNEKQTSKLEVRIRDMDKIEEDTSSIWKQLTELQEYINVNKEDLQSIRMYQIKLDLKLFELLKLTLDESL